MKIIKRNGSEVVFDPNKIIVAITKANESVVPSARMTPVQIKRIAEDVESAALNMNRSLNVEEIQDMVENQIMNQRAFDVARRYITYRYTRALVRKANTTDEQILIVHIREPLEIAKFVKATGGEARTLLVRAGERLKRSSYGNAADDEVENYFYDYYFDNDKSLEEAEGNITKLFSMILSGDDIAE